LRSLVSQIWADTKASDYYIGGFSHPSEKILQMCCIVAASSQVSEACLSMVLQDDRVARNIAQLDERRNKEVERALEIPDHVLLLLGSSCGTTVGELRHEIAGSVAPQAGYIEAKLRPARGLPWSLLRGDVLANLVELGQGPRPTESISAKIHSLVTMGYPIAELVRGVGLLSECNWSTRCVEQGHSVASGIMNAHPRYTRETLTARAMVQQCAVLFRQDPVHRKIEACRRRLHRMRRRRPDRINGKHAYCGSLFAEGRRWKRRGVALPGNFAKTVMKKHGKEWACMPRQSQRNYHVLAADLREERTVQLTSRMAKERERLRQLRAEHQRSSGQHDGPKFLLGNVDSQ